MYTLSAFLPFFFSLSLIITVGYSSAPLDDQEIAASSSKLRKVKGAFGNSQESPVISGTYIVRLNDKTSAATVKSTAAATVASMQTLKTLLISNGTIPIASNDVAINVQPELIFTSCIKGFVIQGIHDVMYSSLLQITGVIRVEPDRITSITTKPGNEVSITSIPWGVHRVRGDTPPQGPITGKAFVIDTGIYPTTFLDIDNELSVNFVADATSRDWQDQHGHGTHAAGIIAAKQNSVYDVVGVVPGAKVVAVRVLNDYGEGDLSLIILGVEYVSTKAKKGDVAFIGVNIRGNSIILNAAVQNAASKGIKFAIQAGDMSMDAEYFTPARASGQNIYTVSAYDQSDAFASSSNFGKLIDYGAPGVDILSFFLDRSSGQLTVDYKSGTSPAAAHIAGLLLTGQVRIDGYVTEDRDNFPDPIAVYDGPSPPPPKNLFNLKILTDKWGDETSFFFRKLSPGTPTLIDYRNAGSLQSTKVYDCFIALDMGTYELELRDTWGDGILGPGYYTLTLGGNFFKTGGSFYSFDSTTFTVDRVETAPTNYLDCRVTAYAAAPSLVQGRAPKPVVKVAVKAPKPLKNVTTKAPQPVIQEAAGVPKPVQKKDKKPKK